jgi:lycopene cyclase domain-containing protein
VDRFQYLMVLAACVAVTLPLELGPARFGFGARVWRRPGRLARAVAPVAAVFVAWDLWATHTGTWDFAERYTIGVRFPGGMAVEELAFFVVVPVCGLLTLVTVRRMLALLARRRSEPAQTAHPDRVTAG